MVSRNSKDQAEKPMFFVRKLVTSSSYIQNNTKNNVQISLALFLSLGKA